MKASVIAITVGCFVAAPVAARAVQTIATPAAFAGFNQQRAECFIANIGTSPITVDAHIYDESGNVMDSGSNCTFPIGGQTACTVSATIGFGAAYACAAKVFGNPKKLRANLLIYDAAFAILRSIDLE
ncbi:MAG TPA: hypothetical protein VFD92_13175 [Candidatus Binatia bacterium]|nr:hypothetical protein [Candidatus Binatia bacterium]